MSLYDLTIILLWSLITYAVLWLLAFTCAAGTVAMAAVWHVFHVKPVPMLKAVGR